MSYRLCGHRVCSFLCGRFQFYQVSNNSPFSIVVQLNSRIIITQNHINLFRPIPNRRNTRISPPRQFPPKHPGASCKLGIKLHQKIGLAAQHNQIRWPVIRRIRPSATQNPCWLDAAELDHRGEPQCKQCLSRSSSRRNSFGLIHLPSRLIRQLDVE
jgi:hypothetical protein